MTITDLQTEYRVNPLGLDSTTPRLSWRLETDRPGARQTAYHLRVATAAEKLAEADLLDSGKVASDQSFMFRTQAAACNPVNEPMPAKTATVQTEAGEPTFRDAETVLYTLGPGRYTFRVENSAGEVIE